MSNPNHIFGYKEQYLYTRLRFKELLVLIVKATLQFLSIKLLKATLHFLSCKLLNPFLFFDAWLSQQGTLSLEEFAAFKSFDIIWCMTVLPRYFQPRVFCIVKAILQFLSIKLLKAALHFLSSKLLNPFPFFDAWLSHKGTSSLE